MKRLIKSVTIMSLISINLVCADNKGVVQHTKNGVVITQNQRISNNFKKIDKLFTSINKKISDIEKTRKDIDRMTENKENEVLCAVIDSLDRDINILGIEIKKVEDNSTKSKLENKLNEHKSVRDEEKSKLDKLNYQCEKL
jgi:prefoldin subunit 5